MAAGRDTNRSPRPADAAFVARVRLGKIFRPVPMEFVVIAVVALALMIFGVVMVTSATAVRSIEAGQTAYAGGETQLLYAIVAVVLMIGVSQMPIRVVRALALPALIAALMLQMLVFTPLGSAVGGNRNWIKLGESMTIQPSEFLKLGIVVWIAFFVSRRMARVFARRATDPGVVPTLHSFFRSGGGRLRRVLVPIVLMSLVVLGSVMAGRDLGTAAILAMIIVGALFFAGVPVRVIALPALFLAAGAIWFTMSSPNRMGRLATVFGDCLEAHQVLDSCYQPLHGIWGLASGGVFGLGLGASREKYGWLPAIADDYIFALVGEELGLLGALALIGLYAVFAWATLRVIRRTTDVFARIAVGGIVVWIIGQATVNIGVVLRLLPPLGVPLPFLSAGGSSLVALGAACGVVLSCASNLAAPAPQPTPAPHSNAAPQPTPAVAPRRSVVASLPVRGAKRQAQAVKP